MKINNNINNQTNQINNNIPNKIDLSYYALGNRNFTCFNNLNKKDYITNSSFKANSLNLMERNYLSLPHSTSCDNIYKPEYKHQKVYSEINKDLNSYLNPLTQYKYKENPLIKSSLNIFNFIKEKNFSKYKKLDNNNENNFQNENNNKDKIILKEKVNFNLIPKNSFHLESNSKFLRRIVPPNTNPNFSQIKLSSFLESKDSPEYLRNYDKESLKNINEYYKNKNMNINVLSRFGNWITLNPNDLNRSHALEKIKQNTYETSNLVPDWMNIKNKKKPKNLFKSFQGNNNARNSGKVTMLIDKDQKNVLPLFLMDRYDQENNVWRGYE